MRARIRNSYEFRYRIGTKIGGERMVSMDHWYFAYGSNLWKEQMIQRTGSIGHADFPPRRAYLADHRLVFQHLDPSEPAYANIVSPGNGVQGVVYRCSMAALEIMDRYENGYQRHAVQVTDQSGEVLTAVAYIMLPAAQAILGSPSTEYLQRIATGAREHGLPSEYIHAIIANAGSCEQLSLEHVLPRIV